MACRNSPEHALNRKFVLNNGVEMPAIGLGTYRIYNHDTIMHAVDAALNAGYRMFDTAAVYNNERHIGQALKTLLPKYGLEREEIFVTTKLNPRYHGGNQTISAFMRSLDNLGLDYIDLFLIHFPGTAKVAIDNPQNRVMREQTWEKLVEMYDDGKAKAIGVSNYTLRHLDELMKRNHGVAPSVNQVEWHPYFFQPELLSYCQSNDIILQAYCSFGGTSQNNNALVQEQVVVNIAKKIGVSPQQILLAWALQQQVAIIPKSTNADHIAANTQLDFVISDKDMKALNKLGDRNMKYAWDPSPVL